MLRNTSTRVASVASARGFHASAPVSQIYDSILDTIGKTPVVRLNNIVPRDDVTVYAKWVRPTLLLLTARSHLACG
jgi:hypothetical protein